MGICAAGLAMWTPLAAGEIIYVDAANAAVDPDGGSWATAYASLQNAIASVNSSPTQIWVREGVYHPDEGAQISPGDRTVAFDLPDGVAIYGGFAGTESYEEFDRRDPRQYVTILSGDLNDDDATAGNGENSYHVVTSLNNPVDTILDGFVISGGNADNAADVNQRRGGGLWLSGSSVRIVDCVVRGSTATSDGGGVYVASGSAAFSKCVFSTNAASQGGAVYIADGSPSFVNSKFSANAAIAQAGACFVSSGFGGGGLPAKVVNCTIVNNSSASLGTSGGVFSNAAAHPVIINSIVWANSGAGSSNQAAQISPTNLTEVDYCCIAGSTAYPGVGNTNADPLFTPSHHLEAGSACIDAGEDNPLPGAFEPATSGDLDGHPRLFDEPGVGGSALDMGCYERSVVLSLVFVLDSSGSMLRQHEPAYWELARQGIVDFVKQPGFPTNGDVEVAVLQFAALDSPAYFQDRHWIAPTRITSEEGRAAFLEKVGALDRAGQPSASLMEVGLREALAMWSSGPDPDPDYGSSAVEGTRRHIVLLSSGEFRLPVPCPHICYAVDGQDPVGGWDCAPVGNCQNCASTHPDCQASDRSCPIRYFAALARGATEGVTLSALRIGPDWDPVFTQDDLSRMELLRQITNVDEESADSVGRLADIAAIMCASCDREHFVPGTSEDVARAINGWFCAPEELGAFRYRLDEDADGVHDLCDNCLACSNTDQQDCNGDGVGDVCQPSCDADAPDQDGDGLWDGIDTCVGGDDCLVAEWTEHLPCDRFDECGGDCDSDGMADACQAAIEVAIQDIDCSSAPAANPERQLCEGIPAPCQYDAVDPIVIDFEGPTFDLGQAHGQSGWRVTEGALESVTIKDFEAGDGHGQVLAIEFASGGQGTAVGPGLDPPWWDCAAKPGQSQAEVGEEDEGTASGTACHAALPYADSPWSVLVLEFDLRIKQGSSDLYISVVSADPEMPENDTRAYLWFEKQEDGTYLGHLMLSDGWERFWKALPDDTWQHIAIAFGEIYHYRSVDGLSACVYVPDLPCAGGACELYGDVAAGVRVGPDENWADYDCGSQDPSIAAPFKSKGVQLRVLKLDDATGGEFRLDNISLRSSDICGWEGRADDPDCLDCSGQHPDTTGICLYANGWDCGYCTAGTDCCASHDEPGCGDVDCCERVCRIQPNCCTHKWTQSGDCAELAAELCDCASE
jgi:hypothetical protein